jgi:hypothetical protein
MEVMGVTRSAEEPVGEVSAGTGLAGECALIDDGLGVKSSPWYPASSNVTVVLCLLLKRTRFEKVAVRARASGQQ